MVYLGNKGLICHLCKNFKNALMDANFYIYAFVISLSIVDYAILTSENNIGHWR